MAATHSAPRTGRRRQHGLTLLEVAVVVAITAIVAAAVAPSFRALIDARRLDAAATRLAADVQLARSEAIARNRSLRLSVYANATATCWVVHSGAPADCRCGDASAVCSDGAKAITSVVLASNERISVAGNVASIVFDPLHGTSTPTGTLRLVGAHGEAVHHVVNVVGRVRSCSPDRAVPGYPSC